MEILGLIPARGGSKGIPGKNLKRLGGKPLIAYTFDQAQASRSLTRLVLTTDDPLIARLGRAAGIEVPFLRPARFARDRSPAADYIRHCLVFLQEEDGWTPDLVVLLQPTAPLRLACDIDACVALMLRKRAGTVVSVGPSPSQYHPFWQFKMGRRGQLLPYGGWKDLGTRRQDLPPTWVRNGAVYVFRPSRFIAAGSIYKEPIMAYPMPYERSINIDDPCDWAEAEAQIRKIKRGAAT